MGPLPFFQLTPKKRRKDPFSRQSPFAWKSPTFPGKQTDRPNDKISIMLHLFRLCLSFLPDVPHGNKAQDHVGQALFPMTLEKLTVQKGHLCKRIPRDCQLGTVTGRNSSVSVREPGTPMSPLILGWRCRYSKLHCSGSS